MNIYGDDGDCNLWLDADGWRVAETNQDVVATRFGYDGAGRLVAVTNAFGTGQQMVTRYEYDEAGNELAQIDALNRTNSCAYDSQGRRIRHTLPGGQVEGFAFDLGGNLVYQTNFNGRVITNQYDELNRLTNVVGQVSGLAEYAYDGVGNLQTAGYGNGVTNQFSTTP